MSTSTIPPQPIPDPDSRGFWEATREGHLALQQCASCARWQFPALERCRHCAGELHWKPVSGKGVVHTFVIQHHASVPGFTDKVPFVVALMTPDEQADLRIPIRIQTDHPHDVRIGDRLTAKIEPLPGGEFNVPVATLSI